MPCLLIVIVPIRISAMPSVPCPTQPNPNRDIRLTGEVLVQKNWVQFMSPYSNFIWKLIPTHGRPHFPQRQDMCGNPPVLITHRSRWLHVFSMPLWIQRSTTQHIENQKKNKKHTEHHYRSSFVFLGGSYILLGFQLYSVS